MTTYEQSTESGELSAVDTLISGEYARQNAKLTEIHRDFFNAVVSGRRPVSDVDTFQQEWLDAGGQLCWGASRPCWAERGGGLTTTTAPPRPSTAPAPVPTRPPPPRPRPRRPEPPLQ